MKRKTLYCVVFLMLSVMTALRAEIVKSSTSASTATYSQRPPKMLTVNIQEVLSKYNRAQESAKKFEALYKTQQEELQSMMDEGIQLVDELKKIDEKLRNPSISAEARKALEEEAHAKAEDMQKKQMGINEFNQEAEMQLSQRRQAIIELHLREIQDAVAKIARDQKVDIVLNISNMAGVAYADPTYDVTAEVLKLLNTDQLAKQKID